MTEAATGGSSQLNVLEQPSGSGGDGGVESSGQQLFPGTIHPHDDEEQRSPLTPGQQVLATVSGFI